MDAGVDHKPQRWSTRNAIHRLLVPPDMAVLFQDVQAGVKVSSLREPGSQRAVATPG